MSTRSHLIRMAIVALAVLSVPLGAQAQLPTGALAVDNGSGLPGTGLSLMVRLTIDTPADGFSFGLTHDGALLNAAALVPGPTLDATQGGTTPDIFITDLVPVGGPGITIGCLVDLGPPPFATIPIGIGQPIVEVTYDISATAAPGPTPLAFSELLGSPPVDNVLSLNGIEVEPTVVDGTVTVLAVPFVRGDCNADGHVNLIDAVTCLRRLFAIEPPGSCADAEDFNDNGTHELADATYLLLYLFGGGAPPPAPFTGCGTDPTADSLGCIEFVPCP